MSKTRWARLNRRIEACETCTRLRAYCAQVALQKRKSYRDQDYWGRPVPNFGAPDAKLLVVGLAPGAHGANRTGRMFTGDRSGDWLYRALFRAGFANQPESTTRQDGLKLLNCVITNICRCAPPDNRPLGEEIEACRPFLQETLELCRPKVIVALGGLAWNATIKLLIECEQIEPIKPRPKFGHGVAIQLADKKWLLGSYHPSQQNTFTGRLTEPMLDEVFSKAKQLTQ